MRDPQEMVTASRMQNMVQIRKETIYFVTKKFVHFFLYFFTFRALGVYSRRGGAISQDAYVQDDVPLHPTESTPETTDPTAAGSPSSIDSEITAYESAQCE